MPQVIGSRRTKSHVSTGDRVSERYRMLNALSPIRARGLSLSPRLCSSAGRSRCKLRDTVEDPSQMTVAQQGWRSSSGHHREGLAEKVHDSTARGKKGWVGPLLM